MVKLVTWNVNGYRSVFNKGGFKKLIEEHKPDFILLQEVKAKRVQADAMVGADGTKYRRNFLESVIGSRHGVAIYVREGMFEENPDSKCVFLDGYTLNGIPNNSIDPKVNNQYEARINVALLLHKGQIYIVINVYSVNSRNGLVRLHERGLFDQHLNQLVKALRVQFQGAHVILAGDLNVVAGPIDYHGIINPNQAGMSKQEQDSFNSLLETNNLVDAFRYKYPLEQEFSWWSYAGRARELNLGWRIDYFLVDESIKSKIKDIATLGTYQESDHAPILMEIDL